MHAFEVLVGSSFSGALMALLFVGVCACTLFAARMGDRAENIAAAVIAYRFLLSFLLGGGPDTHAAWRGFTATIMALDVAVSVALLVVALRYRRWSVGALSALALAAAVASLFALGEKHGDLPSHGVSAAWALALAVLCAATVAAMRRRRRFGYPLAPARSVRPLLLRTVRGLVDPRGRLDRRGFLVWTVGLTLGVSAFAFASVCATLPLAIHAVFLDRAGLDRPILALIGAATVAAAAAPAVLGWCYIAISVRRLRDISPRPLLCLAALFAAGVAEGALGLAPAFGEIALTSVVGPALLLLWPGRQPVAAAEPQRARPPGLVPAAA